MPFQNNRWQDVQKVASHWVEKEPSNAEAWYYMGEAAQHMGDGQAATMHYQKALSLHPNHPATLQATALLAQKNGKQEETNKIRITLKEINPQLLEDLDSAAQAECLASTKRIEC
jgi:cytochrome c-type biogenesis protein CcmH/NrfG